MSAIRLRITTGGALQSPLTERVYEGELVSIKSDVAGDVLIELQTGLQDQPIGFTSGPHLAIEQVS
jgi:hypothetical protein